jgi:DNA repair protein RecO (recombination protein O)
VRRRVQLEPAYLLHQRPFKDSGRILDLLSRDHGRVHLFARGTRGGKSPLGAVLQPFQALIVSWSGSAEGGTLTGAELAEERGPRLPPARLLAGFYLNELLMKLLAEDDAHPELYAHFGAALAELAGEAGEARALRLFEKRLLDALGLGIDYSQVAGGAPVEPNGYYRVLAGRGVVGPLPEGEPGLPGEHLLALAAEFLPTADSVATARHALSGALEAALDGRALASRGVARAVQAAHQRSPRTSSA